VRDFRTIKSRAREPLGEPLIQSLKYLHQTPALRQKNMDKSIMIQSEARAHLGFVLMANNEGEEGECVFMPLPKDPKLFELPDYLFLRRFGAKESGEHKWKKTGDVVSIELTTGDQASMDLASKTLIFDAGMRIVIV
jgi:hypothetical protein